MELEFWNAYNQVLEYCEHHNPPIPPPNNMHIGVGDCRYFIWNSTTGQLHIAGYDKEGWRNLTSSYLWKPDQSHSDGFEIPTDTIQKLIACSHQMHRVIRNLPWNYDYSKNIKK